MASLTIRGLDEATKRQLKLQAARNGRSMEDELRNILRAAAEGEQAAAGPAPASSAAPDSANGRAVAAPRVLLVIGGGIAAYKSLDLIRRLRERGVTVRVILTKAGQEFITPLSVGALAGEHAFTDLFDAKT